MCVCVCVCVFTKSFEAQSARAAEYTDCISAEGKTPPPTRILDMTLNNLMVTLQ